MIQSKDQLRQYLADDLRAHGMDRWRGRYRITKRVIYWQRLLRRCEYWTNCRSDLFGSVYARALRLRVSLLGERLGFTIPLNTFGPGLSIAHVGTIVVNPRSRIGANCRIHQGVTLGEVDRCAPVIGDNVWIGPGAQIFGPITVGDGAAVGANSVVNKNVAPCSTVAGAPARKIRDYGYRPDATHDGRPLAALDE